MEQKKFRWSSRSTSISMTIKDGLAVVSQARPSGKLLLRGSGPRDQVSCRKTLLPHQANGESLSVNGEPLIIEHV